MNKNCDGIRQSSFWLIQRLYVAARLGCNMQTKPQKSLTDQPKAWSASIFGAEQNFLNRGESYNPFGL